jgi:outer membrane lipopolysaccharide assembly protein LptE/RlpB
MRKNKLLIFYLSMFFILSSCGFELRKPIELDYQSYSIIGKANELSKYIDKQLSFAEIEYIKDGEADLIIEIIANESSQRILSLAGNGQVGEFELIQVVEYRFKTNGKWSQARKLEASREYTYDPTLYNAAAAEAQLLRNSMVEQLSRSLITEINNLGK